MPSCARRIAAGPVANRQVGDVCSPVFVLDANGPATLSYCNVTLQFIAAADQSSGSAGA